MVSNRELRVRGVRVSEAPQLRSLRLAALAADPAAFAADHQQTVAQSQDFWRQWLALPEDCARTFVLTDERDRWVGLAFVRIKERPETAGLFGMWVAPEARGCGGARALCDACAKWATQHGCSELTLSVGVENTHAMSAYGAAGFVIQGEATWFGVDRALRVLAMSRAL